MVNLFSAPLALKVWENPVVLHHCWSYYDSNSATFTCYLDITLLFCSIWKVMINVSAGILPSILSYFCLFYACKLSWFPCKLETWVFVMKHILSDSIFNLYSVPWMLFVYIGTSSFMVILLYLATQYAKVSEGLPIRNISHVILWRLVLISLYNNHNLDVFE